MAKLRPATAEEIARWDRLVVANPDGGHYLQSKAWADFRSTRGYKPQYLIYENSTENLAALALERSVAGFGQFWYFSKGPGVTTYQDLSTFSESLRTMRPGSFFARLEPSIVEEPAKAQALTQMGLKRAKQQIIKATIIVDLAGDEESIINSFKQKTRYNVRLAAKHGVTVKAVEATEANLSKMYELMQTTQARAGYFLHSKPYFMALWKQFAEAGAGQLFFASFEGQTLAGVFAIYLGKKGWYKDGGSTREHSNVMAPYLLQWEVMRWLRTKGVTSYDMVGVAPRSQAGHHIMDSLEHFKSGFSQNITEWIGTWDVPLSSKYTLWRKGGERLAVAYHGRVKKEFIY